ncbi:transcription initiation factor iih-related [Anaeramoeba flamelloides]|uniref:Transcription initiation factor iih-related n=1 Tax=Anaeramoeba flamelloides TaxID=1746091 RepID=A0ABQ8YKA9_9EUKA|nr:transcription initiation factor iih-related [Anaeramoeba flamelloides]
MQTKSYSSQVRHNKKEGKLTFDTTRIFFKAIDERAPSKNIRIQDIKKHASTKKSAKKVVLRIVDKKGLAHDFFFFGESKLKERDRFHNSIERLLKLHQSRSNFEMLGNENEQDIEEMNRQSLSAGFVRLIPSTHILQKNKVQEIIQDEKLRKKNEQKRALLNRKWYVLSNDQDTQELYTELVLKQKLVSDRDFWLSLPRLRDLEMSKTSQQQKGMSSSLVTHITPSNDTTTEVKFELTRSMVRQIFLEKPHIKRSYEHNVPDKMDELTFWTRYCDWFYFPTRRSKYDHLFAKTDVTSSNSLTKLESSKSYNSENWGIIDLDTDISRNKEEKYPQGYGQFPNLVLRTTSNLHNKEIVGLVNEHSNFVIKTSYKIPIGEITPKDEAKIENKLNQILDQKKQKEMQLNQKKENEKQAREENDNKIGKENNNEIQKEIEMGANKEKETETETGGEKQKEKEKESGIENNKKKKQRVERFKKRMIENLKNPQLIPDTSEPIQYLEIFDHNKYFRGFTKKKNDDNIDDTMRKRREFENDQPINDNNNNNNNNNNNTMEIENISKKQRKNDIFFERNKKIAESISHFDKNSLNDEFTESLQYSTKVMYEFVDKTLLNKTSQQIVRGRKQRRSSDMDNNSIPPEFISQLFQYQNRINELLRHFWGSFPITSLKRAKKIKRVFKTLDNEHKKLKEWRDGFTDRESRKLRDFILPLFAQLSKAISKFQDVQKNLNHFQNQNRNISKNRRTRNPIKSNTDKN